LRNRAAGGRLAEPGLPWVHLRSVQEFHCVPCRGLGSRAVSIGYKTSVHCHGKQSIDTAAGDYGSVWLAFPAKARRHRSGAFMRSQVRLKSSVGPLHNKSSMEVNTGTSTRSVARVRNNTASSHAAKRDSAKAPLSVPSDQPPFFCRAFSWGRCFGPIPTPRSFAASVFPVPSRTATIPPNAALLPLFL